VVWRAPPFQSVLQAQSAIGAVGHGSTVVTLGPGSHGSCRATIAKFSWGTWMGTVRAEPPTPPPSPEAATKVTLVAPSAW